MRLHVPTLLCGLCLFSIGIEIDRSWKTNRHLQANPLAALTGQRSARVKSVVIKIGTNALSDGSGRLDNALIGHFAEQVAGLMARKIRVTMVSSGAIGAGMTELGLGSRPKDLPMLQATASRGAVDIDEFVWRGV